MNGNPGVLAVMDAATMSMDDAQGDDLREARATVARLAEALNKASAALSMASVYVDGEGSTDECDQIDETRTEVDAALAAFRGEGA